MEQENSVPFKAVNRRKKLSQEEYIQRRDAATQNEILRLTQDPALTQLLASRRRSELYHQTLEMISMLFFLVMVFAGIVGAFIYAPTLSRYSKSEVRNFISQQLHPALPLHIKEGQVSLLQPLSELQYATMNDLYDQIAQLKQQISKQNIVVTPNIVNKSKLRRSQNKSSFILSKFVESHPEYLNFDGDFCPVLNFANFFVPKQQTCVATELSFGQIFGFDDLLELVSNNLGVFTVVAALIVSVLTFKIGKQNSRRKNSSKNLQQNGNAVVEGNLSNGVCYDVQQKSSLSLEMPIGSLESQDEQQFLKIVSLFGDLQEQVLHSFKQKCGQSEEVAAFCTESLLDNDGLENNSCREVLDFIVEKLSGITSLIGELEQQVSQSEVEAESCRIGLQQQEESYQEYRKVTIEQMDQVKVQLRQSEKHIADLKSQIQAFENERDGFREKESSLLSSISQLEFEFGELTAEKENSQQDVNLKQLKIDELEAIHGIQMENMKQDQSQFSQLQNKLLMEQQMVLKQKHEIKRQQTELEDYKIKVQALNSQMDAMSQSLQNMENMVCGEQQELQRQAGRNQVKELQDKLWQKENEYSDLLKNHGSLQQQIKWLQQSHDDLSSQLNIEQSKVRAGDEEKQQIEEKLGAFQSEYSQIQDNIIQLMNCNEELQKKLQQHNKEGVQGGQKQMMQLLLQQIFTKELKIVMMSGSGDGNCGNFDELSVEQLKNQIMCLNNDKLNLQMEVQRLSSDENKSMSLVDDGGDFYKQRTEQIMSEIPQRISEISKILRGSISSPEYVENQQVISSVRINQLYEDYMQEIYNSQSYVPVMEVEEHFRNLKENGCFVDLSNKENTILNDQSGCNIDSGMCEQIENIIGQYSEVEEKLAQKVFDKANLIYHSTGLHELVEQNINDMESLESMEEKQEQDKQQLEQLQKYTRELVSEEDEMVQCLNDTQKEIEDLQESQDGLYRQYYDLTKAAISMSDGPTDYSTFILLPGQSLSPIQSHSSAERIAANEQDYSNEAISSGGSSLPGTPFKERNKSADSSPSFNGARRLNFSPSSSTRYTAESPPLQNIYHQDESIRGRTLNIVSHCPSDQSSFSPDEDSNNSVGSDSPALKNLSKQLFQDEDSSPVKAEPTQFITPPRHATFQRAVMSEADRNQEQQDIFKDDIKSGDVAVNVGQELDGSTSRTLFMTPKAGYPQTPYSTPNYLQQENNSPNVEFRTPLSPRE